VTIRSHIDALRETVPPEVKLVAVSKFHPAEKVRQAYDAGLRVFGESRVQELLVKKNQLPDDIEWHFIGSLQRNKVRLIAPFISLIHSIDSERLLLEVEKQAAANHRTIACLLQIHIAEEESKAGLAPDECRRLLAEGNWRNCRHVRIAGVMGMATFTDDQNQVRKEFGQLKALRDELKAAWFGDDPLFGEISMGMTGDYRLAIEEGSTMIRVGTLIFDRRY
jgi:pyridoxal phosphate enzyme (YggS family)